MHGNLVQFEIRIISMSWVCVRLGFGLLHDLVGERPGALVVVRVRLLVDVVFGHPCKLCFCICCNSAIVLFCHRATGEGCVFGPFFHK